MTFWSVQVIGWGARAIDGAQVVLWNRLYWDDQCIDGTAQRTTVHVHKNDSWRYENSKHKQRWNRYVPLDHASECSVVVRHHFTPLPYPPPPQFRYNSAAGLGPRWFWESAKRNARRRRRRRRLRGGEERAWPKEGGTNKGAQRWRRACPKGNRSRRVACPPHWSLGNTSRENPLDLGRGTVVQTNTYCIWRRLCRG